LNYSPMAFLDYRLNELHCQHLVCFLYIQIIIYSLFLVSF